MLGHGQRSGAWVEDSRTSDSSSSFSTFFFLPAQYPLLNCFLGKQRMASSLYPSGQIQLVYSLQSHCRVLAGVFTACREGQKAGGQAEAGDTAAAA